MSSISPRVNAALLPRFIGQPVRIVGTVLGYDEAKANMFMQASDGVQVSVLLAPQNQGLTFESGQVVEVIGQAQGNAQPTVTEYTTIPFSKDFNLPNYDRLVNLIQGKHADLFQ